MYQNFHLEILTKSLIYHTFDVLNTSIDLFFFFFYCILSFWSSFTDLSPKCFVQLYRQQKYNVSRLYHWSLQELTNMSLYIWVINHDCLHEHVALALTMPGWG